MGGSSRLGLHGKCSFEARLQDAVGAVGGGAPMDWAHVQPVDGRRVNGNPATVFESLGRPLLAASCQTCASEGGSTSCPCRVLRLPETSGATGSATSLSCPHPHPEGRALQENTLAPRSSWVVNLACRLAACLCCVWLLLPGPVPSLGPHPSPSQSGCWEPLGAALPRPTAP